MVRKMDIVNINRILNCMLIKRFKHGADTNYGNTTQMIIVEHLKLLITFKRLQNIVKALYLPR